MHPHDTGDYRTSAGLIIVPAYNESASIGPLVDELTAHSPGLDVLVIDDGSTDGTAGRVPESATVLRLPFNMGIGAAMQTGFRYAKMHGYKVAVQVDGDGQHPPAEVGKLIDYLHARKVDMVVGSRFKNGNHYPQTAARRVGALILRRLIRLLVGRDLTDCTSGFRAVNGRVIEAFAHWYPEDYPEPEVIVLLHRAGYSIEEMPVRMHRRHSGRTSIPLSKGFFYVIKVAACLVLDMVRDPWPRRAVQPR